jgi:hypothetical protein
MANRLHNRCSAYWLGASILILFLIGLAILIKVWSVRSNNLQAVKERENDERALLDGRIAEVRQGKEDSIELYDPVDTDSMLLTLRHLKGLHSLKLDSTNVTDRGMSYIRDVPDLQTLDISGAKGIHNQGIDALTGHPNIESLSLDYPAITDTGIELLSKLPKLQSLSLYPHTIYSKLTDKALNSISKMHALKKLVISGGWYTQQALESLKKNRPDLQITVVVREPGRHNEKEGPEKGTSLISNEKKGEKTIPND